MVLCFIKEGFVKKQNIYFHNTNTVTCQIYWESVNENSFEMIIGRDGFETQAGMASQRTEKA